MVSPDVATLSFSVVSEGADPEKLQNDNTDKINKALDFVKSEGVESKDIKTAGYNLSPRYKYDQKTGRSSIDGYTLPQTVIVKIRDLSKVGPLGRNHKNDLADALRVEKRSRRVRPPSKSKVR